MTTVVTGLRANNDLHIGNYFGALLPIVTMAQERANDYQINLFVPDLHSFTTPIDHSVLQSQIMRNLQLFVAAGLPIDHQNVHLYRQSYVPAHSELTWILDCFTGMGEMSRMTQFKDKSASLNEDRVSVGLFNYPVLMTADVLLYDAEYVPVGDDQSQHLEYMRNVAERMNNQFNAELFVLPKPVNKQHEFFGKDQGLRIKDLQNPDKKMSKSADSNKGVIFLGDEPNAAKQKIISATTDSLAQIKYDPINQPGVSNLVQIFALLKGVSTSEIEQEYSGVKSYGDFKNALAEELCEFLTDFQEKLAAVDEDRLMQKLAVSEKLMNQKANQTLLNVQKAVGLR